MMLKKMTLSMVLLSLFSFGFGLPVRAQTDQQKSDKRANKVRKKIERLGRRSPSKVDVTLFSDRRLEGTLREIGADTFAVVDQNGAATVVRYTDVKTVYGAGASKGGKIALFAVLGAAATGAAIAIWYFVTINNN